MCFGTSLKGNHPTDPTSTPFNDPPPRRTSSSSTTTTTTDRHTSSSSTSPLPPSYAVATAMNSRNRNRNRTGTGTGHPTHNTETSLSFAPSAPRRPRNPYTDPDAPEYYELPSRHISVAEARKISEARRLQLQERMGGPPTGPGISSSGFGLSGHYGAF